MQLVNGAQFLNATPLSHSSACLPAASSPAPVIVIFPLTRIYRFGASSIKFAIFGIPLLHYYINLNSSIIFCLSCGDIYLFFGISLFVLCDGNFFKWDSFADFF